MDQVLILLTILYCFKEMPSYMEHVELILTMWMFIKVEFMTKDKFQRKTFKNHVSWTIKNTHTHTHIFNEFSLCNYLPTFSCMCRLRGSSVYTRFFAILHYWTWFLIEKKVWIMYLCLSVGLSFVSLNPMMIILYILIHGLSSHVFYFFIPWKK
jgi:hypothetical protein